MLDTLLKALNITISTRSQILNSLHKTFVCIYLFIGNNSAYTNPSIWTNHRDLFKYIMMLSITLLFIQYFRHLVHQFLHHKQPIIPNRILIIQFREKNIMKLSKYDYFSDLRSTVN